MNKGIVKEGQYCGIDILDKMREANDLRYPGYRFLTRNLIESPLEEKYDVVVMCGVFNLRTSNGDEYMRQLLKNAFACCNKLMTFNFISTYVNFKDDEIEYHNPTEVMNFCLNELSTKVIMEHHYWKCDVSCRVYR